MTYFPRFGKKETIRFSYFSRIQTEAKEQMEAGEGCCGGWVVSDGVWPQGRGPHHLFGGVGCTMEILMGVRGG